MLLLHQGGVLYLNRANCILEASDLCMQASCPRPTRLGAFLPHRALPPRLTTAAVGALRHPRPLTLAPAGKGYRAWHDISKGVFNKNRHLEDCMKGAVLK